MSIIARRSDNFFVRLKHPNLAVLLVGAQTPVTLDMGFASVGKNHACNIIQSRKNLQPNRIGANLQPAPRSGPRCESSSGLGTARREL